MISRKILFTSILIAAFCWLSQKVCAKTHELDNLTATKLADKSQKDNVVVVSNDREYSRRDYRRHRIQETSADDENETEDGSSEDEEDSRKKRPKKIKDYDGDSKAEVRKRKDKKKSRKEEESEDSDSSSAHEDESPCKASVDFHELKGWHKLSDGKTKIGFSRQMKTIQTLEIQPVNIDRSFPRYPATITQCKKYNYMFPSTNAGNQASRFAYQGARSQNFFAKETLSDDNSHAPHQLGRFHQFKFYGTYPTVPYINPSPGGYGRFHRSLGDAPKQHFATN